jgi:hypothetical protein
MDGTYELPWIAETAQRQLEAQTIVGAFTSEIFDRGVRSCVVRFLEEFSAIPGAYKVHVAERFKGEVPAEVKGILASVAEHVSDLQQNLTEGQYSEDTSGFGLATAAAKMAVTTAEVRALNHILGI